MRKKILKLISLFFFAILIVSPAQADETAVIAPADSSQAPVLNLEERLEQPQPPTTEIKFLDPDYPLSPAVDPQAMQELPAQEVLPVDVPEEIEPVISPLPVISFEAQWDVEEVYETHFSENIFTEQLVFDESSLLTVPLIDEPPPPAMPKKWSQADLHKITPVDFPQAGDKVALGLRKVGAAFFPAHQGTLTKNAVVKVDPVTMITKVQIAVDKDNDGKPDILVDLIISADKKELQITVSTPK